MGVGRSVVGRLEAEPWRMSIDKIVDYVVALGAKIVAQPPAVAA